MRVYVGIDDTDNVHGSVTKELADILGKAIEDFGWGRCEGITRHQLFVHSDIPYTSHNSSMCFLVELKDSKLKDLISYASEFLETESAVGSDPGLCVAALGGLGSLEELINFGQRAKQEVLTKQEAYDLAEWLDIHLSEHGGTGQGVIGALAGVGLRLTGNDGRFKGKVKIKSESNIVTVGSNRR